MVAKLQPVLRRDDPEFSGDEPPTQPTGKSYDLEETLGSLMALTVETRDIVNAQGAQVDALCKRFDAFELVAAEERKKLAARSSNRSAALMGALWVLAQIWQFVTTSGVHH